MRMLEGAKILGLLEEDWTEIDRVLCAKRFFKKTNVHRERVTTGDE